MYFECHANILKKSIFIFFIFAFLYFMTIFSFASIDITGVNLPSDADTKIKVVWKSVAYDVYSEHTVTYSLYRSNIQSIDSITTPSISESTNWTQLTTFTDRDANIDRNNLSFLDGSTTPLQAARVYAYKVVSQYTDNVQHVVEDSGIAYISTTKPIPAIIKDYAYDINTHRLSIELDSISRSAARVEVIDSVIGSVYQSSCNGLNGDSKLITFICSDFKVGTSRIITLKHYDSFGVASEPSNYFSVYIIDVPTIFVSMVNGYANLYGDENLPWNYFVFQKSTFASGLWSDWETLTPTQVSRGVYQDKLGEQVIARYMLKTKEGIHYSGYSGVTSTLTNSSALTELKSSFIAGPKVKLTWKNSGVSKKYIRVERRIDNEYYQNIGDIDNTSTYFVDDSNILPNKKYYYRLTEYDNESSYIIGPETFISSAAPTLVLRIVNTSGVKLEWDKTYTDENGVQIMKSVDNNGYTVVDSKYTLDSYVDTSVLNGHNYKYQIKLNSFNDYWNVYSNEVSILCQERIIEITSLEARPETTSSIRLNWRYSDYGGNYAYIERKTSDDLSWGLVAKVDASVNTYLDEGLKEYTKYFYRISVCMGNNVYSDVFPSDDSMYAYTLPESPTGLLSYRMNNDSIRLTWNAQQNIDEFVIYKKSSGESDFTEVTRVAADVSAWEDTDVERQYGYSYKITAIANEVQSLASGEAQIPVPEKPFDKIEYYINGNNLILSWTLAEGFAKPVKIEKLNEDAGTWMPITSIYDTKNSYTDPTVKSGDTYIYRFSALNKKSNQMIKSDEVTITAALIEKPLNLRAIAMSSKAIRLNWMPGSTKKYNYVVYRKKGQEFIEIGRTASNASIYEDKGLIENTNYTYLVRAFGNDIFSAASNEVSAATFPNTHITLPGRYSWAKSAISSLNDKGAIAPEIAVSGNFKPEQAITRGEFLSILIRYIDIDNKKLLPGNFKDINESNWYYYDIATAKSLNIIKGEGGGNFNPSGQISRQDMVVVIVNTLKALKYPIRSYNTNVLNKYADYNKVASYATNAMAFMTAEGILKGNPDGNLNPAGFTTRAEAATLIYNALKTLQ